MVASAALSATRVVAGDDVFISYSRADGATYATGSASELSARNLSCRFDQWGSEPGKKVPESILNDLRRCGMLVIVNSAAAGCSRAVQKEIETFRSTGRLIVPIDLDGTIRQAIWWELVEGLAVSQEERQPEGGVAKRPSQPVLDRIENSINFTRRNQRLRRATVVTLAVMLVLLAGALVAWWSARAAQKENTQLADENRQATADLGKTQHDLGDQRTKLATTQQNLAEQRAELATTQEELGRQRTELGKQRALATKANQDRIAAQAQLATTNTQLAASQADLKKQTDISASQEAARLAPAGPSARRRIGDALKAVERSPTEAAQLTLKQVLLGSLSPTADTQVVFGAEGKELLIASGAGDTRFFNLASGAEFPICGYPEPVSRAAFSDDGSYLITVRPDGRDLEVVQIWDVNRDTAAGMAQIAGEGSIVRIWMSPDNSRLLLYRTNDGPLYILENPTGKVLSQVPIDGEVPEMRFDPQHRTFFVKGTHDKAGRFAHIVDIDSGAILWTQPAGRDVEWFDYVDGSKLIAYVEGGGETSDDKGFKVRPLRGFEILPLNSRGVPERVQYFTVEDFDYQELKGAFLKYLQLGKSFGQIAMKLDPAAKCDSYN